MKMEERDLRVMDEEMWRALGGRKREWDVGFSVMR